MKNLSLFKYLFFAVVLSAIVTSCKKDDTKPTQITGDALFSYAADGYTVVFTNESTVSGTTTNDWDFGDGESSTEKSPTHTYAGKGEYAVKLTVTDANGGKHDITSKVKVDKGTRIDLTDNSFSDWDKVTDAEYSVALGDNSGVIESVVFDYDADNIYVKVKYKGALIDSMVLDVFVDTDIDKSTGFNSTLWTGAGLDGLMEGDVAHEWFDLFDYSGTDNGWGYSPNGETDFYTLGNVEENGDLVTFELAFKRSKVPGFDGDKVKFALQLQKAWAGVGWAPDQFVDGGDETDGFTLEMK